VRWEKLDAGGNCRRFANKIGKHEHPPNSSSTSSATGSTFEPEWVRAWGHGYDQPGILPGLSDMGANQAWDVVIYDVRLYVAGTEQARERGNTDLFVRCYDLDGSLRWEQIWDNGSKDAGFVIRADNDNGHLFLYIGRYTRVGNVNKALFQKRDATDGTLFWSKTWGEIPFSHHEIDGIAIVDDALYVSHYDMTFAGRNINAVLRRFDKRELDRTHGQAAPILTSVWGEVEKEQDSTDGHIYVDKTGVWVTGRIGGKSFLGAGGGDLYLTKIDPVGRQLWLQKWGKEGYDQGLSLASDGERVYVAGMTMGQGATGLHPVVVAFGMDGVVGAEHVRGAVGTGLCAAWQLTRCTSMQL